METPFSLHLLELRLRAAYSLCSFFSTFLVGTLYSIPLTHLICIPFSINSSDIDQGDERVFFIFTHVTEGLYAAIEASFLSAVFFFIPLAAYQIHSFLMPSFYKRERRVVHGVLLSTLILFFVSVYVAFLIVLPKMCAFLQQFQYQSSSMQIKLQARIAPAVRWSGTIFLITAALFQIPVLFALLCRGGLPPKSLSKHRKYAWFLILLVASLLSPPDVSSQSIIAAIGCLLYEFLFWCALVYNKSLPCSQGAVEVS